jgi:hypothetical protein
MYEVRKSGNEFRIYDCDNEQYIGYTMDQNKANRMVAGTLRKMGFCGHIPSFFVNDTEFGLNLDLV